MSRRSWWSSVRYAALTLVMVCGVFLFASARAQVVPADAPVEVVAEDGAGVEETPSPWTAGLVTSTIALAIGGLSAVLGIWVDRDESRPTVFAGAMSVLIVSAVSVGLIHSYLDAVGAIQRKADLDRMMDMVNEIALSSGDPALAALVQSERGPAADPTPAD